MEIEQKILKNNRFWWILFIILNLFLLAFLFYLQITSFGNGNLAGIIDQNFPELNTKTNLFRYLFVWDSSRGIGETQYLFIPIFVDHLLVYFLSLVNSNFTFLNFTKTFLLQISYYFGIFLFLLAVNTFILKKEKNPKNLTLISLFSILSIMNLYFFQSSATFLFGQRFMIFIFGLLFYSINKIIYEKKGYFLFIFSSLLSIDCWSNLLGFWIPLFLFLIIYILIFAKKWDKIKISLLHFLAVAPAFITILFYYREFITSNTAIEAYKQVVLVAANKNSILSNIFLFAGGANLNLTWGWNNNTVYPYYQTILNNPIFLVTAFTLFSIIIFSILKNLKFYNNKNERYFILYISSAIVISIFLIKSINPPFEQIFIFMLNNIPLASIFRETHNKFYPLLIILGLTSILLLFNHLNKNKKMILITILIIYISIFAIIGLSFNIYSKDASFSFPIDRYTIIKSIVPENSRVLFLPEYAYQQRYNFGYTGNSITKFFFNFHEFDISYLLETNFNNIEVRSLLDNFNLLQYPKGVYNFGSDSPSFEESIPINLDIKYIILDKNLIGDASNSQFKGYDIYLSKLKGLLNYKNIFENNDFLILKLINPNPKLITDNLLFQQINPTKYHIYLSDVNSKQNISFLESYHRDWKLYLVKHPTDKWCNQLQYYPATNTTECQHTKKFFEGEELSYLWKTPIFDNTHKMVNGYANSWTIDPDYIKSHYSKDYYTENPDGSINIELVLYFQPQSYFYLGLLISLTTLISCISYLIYNWRRRKLKNTKEVYNI